MFNSTIDFPQPTNKLSSTIKPVHELDLKTDSPTQFENMNFLDDLSLPMDNNDGVNDFFELNNNNSDSNKEKINHKLEDNSPLPILPMQDNLGLEEGFTDLLDPASSISPSSTLPSMDFHSLANLDFPPLDSDTSGMEPPPPSASPPVNLDSEANKNSSDTFISHSTNDSIENYVDPSRTWHRVQMDEQNISGHIDVKSKTRLDAPSPALPDRLYASLKYEIHQTAYGVNPSLPFVLSKAQVCDAETNEVVDKVKNVPALKGTIEAALTRPTSEEDAHTHLAGNLKIQLGNKLSYHSTKKTYYLRISYYQPDNMTQPILVNHSPTFKVFARKPNVDPKNRTKCKPAKRKRNDNNSDENPHKRQRSDNYFGDDQFSNNNGSSSQSNSSNAWDDFKTRLDDLVQVNNQLSTEEKKHAVEMVISKLVDLDQISACNLPGFPGSS